LVALVSGIALIAFSSWLRRNGFVSAAMAREWGEAVLYADGKGAFREFATTYPPLAFAFNVSIGVIARAICSVPSVFVAAALPAALLVATWDRAFRAAGYGGGWSVVLAALIGVHPFFLYAATTGVGSVLLMVAIYWLADAYCASRLNGRVTDLASLAFALAFATFVDPLGALVSIVALPFLPLALPAPLAGSSAPNVLLVLLFPLLFAFLSFAYENALFEGDTTAFLDDAYRHIPLIARAHGLSSGVLGWPGASAAIVIGAVLSLAAAMPAAIRLAWSEGRRYRYVHPIASLCAIAALVVVATGLMAMALGERPTPATLAAFAAPFIGVTAVAIRRWRAGAQRSPAVAVWLLIGVVFGWTTTVSWRAGEPGHWRLVVGGAQVVTAEAGGSAAVGRYLSGLDDVLIDTHAHPEVAAARDSAEGLVVPGDEAFVATVLTHRLSSRFVALADPDLPEQFADDAVALTFPTLYRDGAYGYRLVYDMGGWRVYERNEVRDAH
jgi:hypothetical protein